MLTWTHSIRLVGAAAFVVSLAACDGPPAPSPQPPPPPPPPPTGVTVSGVVFDYTDTGNPRPVPNLRLQVRVSGPLDGAVGSTPLPDTVTDANGRYTITDVTGFFVFFQTDPASDYRFLCDWYPVWLQFPVTELRVVHTSWSGNRPSPPLATWSTFVWGTVSERVDGSLQPVAGATVLLDDGLPDGPATTSANGFYMVCSMVGADQFRDVTAVKTGYDPASREILEGGEAHFQLTRR